MMLLLGAFCILLGLVLLAGVAWFLWQYLVIEPRRDRREALRQAPRRRLTGGEGTGRAADPRPQARRAPVLPEDNDGDATLAWLRDVAAQDSPAGIPDPPSVPAGDQNVPAAIPEGTAGGDEAPGPVEEGDASWASPAPGPGDDPYAAACAAIEAAERAGDSAYTAAIDSGSLPISDADWPHLAKGQYGHWHWASDDSLMIEKLTPERLAELDAQHAGKSA